MRLADIPYDGIRRAVLRAQVTADAERRIDAVCQKRLALLRPALVVPHMLKILVIEIVECGKHRIRRCLPQSAEGGVLDYFSEDRQCLQVFLCAAASGLPVPLSV